jgi:hypothetical protein
MAKETYERLIDDLDRSDATQTVKFGVDGSMYHIDLNDAHAHELPRNAGTLYRASRTCTERPVNGQQTRRQHRAEPGHSGVGGVSWRHDSNPRPYRQRRPDRIRFK